MDDAFATFSDDEDSKGTIPRVVDETATTEDASSSSSMPSSRRRSARRQAKRKV